MDFAKMHYVLAVAELQNFSRAAEKCFISQPALTRSISKVEEELGTLLFDRTCTPVRLTHAGERYVAGIRGILSMKHQLDGEMQDLISHNRDQLIIGIPGTRSETWLSHILPPFLTSYPEIKVSVVEGSSGSLEEALINETIDVNVVASMPLMTPGIDYEPISEEQITIIMPPDSPVFRGNPPPFYLDALHFIPAKLLDGYPYVAVSPKQGLFRIGSQIFEFYGIHPQIVLSLTSPYTAYHMAAEGVGFAVAPAHRAMTIEYRRMPIFCTVFDPPYPRAVIAAWKKGRPLSPAARAFIDSVKRIAMSDPGLIVPPKKVIHDVVFE